MIEIPQSFERYEAEANPKFHDLAIVTSTFYPNDASSQLRAALAKQTVERSRELGLKSVVIEGGSEDTFTEQLVTHTEPLIASAWPAASMGTSRRRGFELALENPATEFVLWLEPEKYDLLRPETVTKLTELARLAEAAEPERAIIVVPKRRSKASYPAFQAEIETKGNREMTQLLGLSDTNEEFDFWFGPKLFNRAAAHFFTGYDGESWNSIFIPAALAVQGGAKLISAEIDFTYPQEQKALEEDHADEFRAKREAQYHQVIDGVKAALAEAEAEPTPETLG